MTHTAIRSRLMQASILAGAVTLLAAAPAVAEQAAQPAQPAANQQQPAQPAAPQARRQESVVVTGSRIRRDEFTSTAPIQVITSEASELEGLTDTAEILQSTPAASGSAQINNFFTGFVVEGGPGVNTISLRGLGAQRTLVLLNGKRLNPAGTRGQVGAVDLNVLPESIIDRIEILKDGASSVYGSDAVAGVINVITRDNLSRPVLEVTANAPFDGGGETFQINGAYGRTFDRGSFSISGEWNKRNELFWGDRDYLSCTEDYVFAAGDRSRRLDLIDPATGRSKCFNTLTSVVDVFGPTLTGAGAATGGGVAGLGSPAAGGAIYRFVAAPSTPGATGFGPPGGLGSPLAQYSRVGLAYGQIAVQVDRECAANPTLAFCGNRAAEVERRWRASQVAVPTDHPLTKNRTAISPVERYSVYLKGAFDLSPNVELYGELLWNRRESETKSFRQLFENIPATAPYNPFGVNGVNAFNAAPRTARSVLILPFNNSQEVDVLRTVVGARGELPDGMGFLSGWSYDVFATYGKSDATYAQESVLQNRYFATLGLTGPSGGTTFTGVCPPTAPAGCVPFNPFDPATVASGVIPQNVINYIQINEIGTTEYTQTMVSGSISGDLFELPAGPVAVALGFEWRNEEIDDTPGVNARTNNLWGLTSAGRTAGDDTVQEFFGEAEIPLIKGVTLIEDLSFNASGRYTDYDSYGTNSTYKLGLNWQITPAWRLRGTFGTSYRAPALYELFLANQTGFQGQGAIDPCINWGVQQTNPVVRANCAADGIPATYGGVGSSALIITGGGAGILEAETSEATTFGLIWTPGFIDLSIGVDYFEFLVDNQVAQFGSANIVGACYAAPEFRASGFCSLFTRQLNPNATNAFNITEVRNNYVNISNQTTEGIDVTARYRHEFSFGTFQANFLGTWTFVDQSQVFAGRPVVDFNGEIAQPDFTAQLDLRFDRGDWTFFWAIDAIAKTSNTEEFGNDVFGWRGFGAASPLVAAPTNVAFYKQYTEMTITHDVSVRWTLDNWTLQAGVQNVFDEPPPAISTGSFFGRLGTAPVAAQYDILGRRGFVTVARRF